MFFVFLIILIPSLYVEAATLQLTKPTTKISQEDEFQVDVVLTSKDKDVNALEGFLYFPVDVLKVSRVIDGGSIINFWVNNPASEENQASNFVKFSGVIPGGYAGEKGKLFSIVFKALKSGNAKITLDKASALENNGSGDSVPLLLQNVSLVIEKSAGKLVLVDDKLSLDTVPPELFDPQIGQDKGIYDGKRFLVFAAVDKDSGIERYEVSEGLEEPTTTSWKVAISPYILNDQTGNSALFVKAVDRAGNERIAKVNQNFSTNYGVMRYLTEWFWIILIVGLSLILIVVIKRKKSLPS